MPVPCFVDEEKAKQDPSYYLKNTNAETRETLQELYRDFKGDEVLAATMKAPEKRKADPLNAVSGCSGSASDQWEDPGQSADGDAPGGVVAGPLPVGWLTSWGPMAAVGQPCAGALTQRHTSAVPGIPEAASAFQDRDGRAAGL